ncbi:MAG: ROK family protein [Dehalococcoidia bacterium]|nr:ROK family protein [Dehalococcoidia bacterium]
MMSGDPLVLVADIGGTSMRAAVVDARGVLIERATIATEPERGLADAAGRLAVLMTEVRANAAVPGEVVAAAVATAGPVDPATGKYRFPPNLPGWHDETMVPTLSEALGLPVHVGHDATLAALAETRFGAGIGMRHLLYVTVSTGIGGGIIVDGRPVTGAHGGAGEVGHMIVAPGGPSCGAGCGGCLEAVASGSGIVAEVRRRGLSWDSAKGVFAAAAEGDAAAREIVESTVRHLANGLASLLAIFDPELVVLGGGVTQGLAPYWADLERLTRDVALPRYAGGVPLARTSLGGDAGLLGAAVLAFQSAGIEARAAARG